MKIENRLRELASTNPNYGLLLAQWEFDKKLLSRALNTVSRDFPHFSLHDASHSSTIINQIEKIISKDIENLSATDCWLILESCYWHDSGMLITDIDKSALLKSNDFLAFIREQKNIDSELCTYISIIEKEDSPKDHFKLYEKSRALTFILADYYRREHAMRSASYVLDPQSIMITSPRTSLIPSRLFLFVAEIVSCHGKSVEKLLEIARSNDGMDSDDYAHPRYVAGLLRIGDLLDIDDGRFCPTMLSNIGIVPPSSLHHQAKHASIKYLHIDSNVIEIKAICPSYESYEAQRHWFDFLENEIRFQNENWNKISPDDNYNRLPIIESLSCDIDGYITIDGQVPKIQLYNKRVYEYLSSNYLYSEKFPYIRETIQNSIDSIYYKIWQENAKQMGWDSNSGNEHRKEFNNLLLGQKINIDLVRVNIMDDIISYALTISDSGLGIDFTNIRKILNVGSPLNKKHLLMRDSMPDWAKPSGFFGLGMQSIFRMVKSAEINTRSQDNIEYTMFTTCENNGDVNVKIRETNERCNNGTSVKLFVDYPKIPSTISHSQIEYLEAYDPIKDDVLEVLPAICEELIKENFRTSPIPIFFNNKKIKSTDATVKWNTESSVNSNYDLGVDFDLSIDLDEAYRTRLLFKGVPFDSNIYFSGIAGNVDIFSKNAAHWLTIDRKKSNNQNAGELFNSIEKLLEIEYEKVIDNTKSKPDAHLFFFSKFNKEFCNLWKDFIVNNNKLIDYLNGNKDLFISNIHSGTGVHVEKTEISTRSLKSQLIGIIAKRENYSFRISIDNTISYDKHGSAIEYNIFKIAFRNDNLGNSEVDLDVINLWLSKEPRSLCARSTIPLYNNKYINISLSEDELEPWMHCNTDFNHWFKNVLLLPAKGETKESDINMIYDFYCKKKTNVLSKDKFIKLYFEFWDDIKV